MKHHDVRRPVGKCKGCCLNLKTVCAGELEPETQWSKGRCRYFGNLQLLEAFINRPQPTGAKLARLVRKAKARAMACEPHYNGVLHPAKFSGTRRSAD